MLYKKLLVLLLSLLIFGQTIAQTVPKPAPKETNVSPKVQEKATDLLNNLILETEQFALPKNRVTARIEVAGLLWERDEKKAKAMFQAAISDLNNLLQTIPPPDEEATDKENSDRYIAIYDLREMRNALLLALAPRDPALALEVSQSLTNEYTDGEDYAGENKALELTLAAQIAKKDPQQAYDVAKKNLEDGISYNLFTALEDLYKTDAELGAKLAKDIHGKITSVGTKITSPYDNAGNSNVNASPPPSESSSIAVWDVQQYYTTVKKLNRTAERNKKALLLSENEIKELVQLLAKKYATQQYLGAYEVAPIMPDLIKFFPAQAQTLRRKIGQDNSAELNTLVSSQIFENEIEGKSPEEVLQVIQKNPAAERDNLYWKAAEKSYNDGDVERAKMFYAKMQTKREYDYLDDRIKADLPRSLAEKGDLRQVRDQLAKLKTPEEKIAMLAKTAETVAVKGDKKTAASLTEEARLLYSGKMKQRRNLESILSLTKAYAKYDPEQSFSFLESNVSFFNDLINAAILLDEFNENGAVQDEELILKRVSDESFRYATNVVVLLKDLAEADFPRTVALADKFSRPEVRFIARLRIAQALLDPNAEKLEQELQTKLNEVVDEH